jgi:hypothetical protein
MDIIGTGNFILENIGEKPQMTFKTFIYNSDYKSTDYK